MAEIPGGSFRMGSEAFYPEERPVHQVEVDGFWIDEQPVTVAEFRRFVKATGYVTLAERPPDPADYPDADPACSSPARWCSGPRAGRSTSTTSATGGPTCPGASWRRPEGPGSDTYTRGRHPVTQVAYEDARPTPRGRARRCRPRPSGSTRRAAASRARRSPGATSSPPAAGYGQHLAGRVPMAEPAGRRLRGHVAGRRVPAERLRAVRHDRQRVGVDDRRFPAARRVDGSAPCCAPATRATPQAPARPGRARSPAASSRAARTCARPTTACATGPRRARPRPSTPRRATSASAASSGPGDGRVGARPYCLNKTGGVPMPNPADQRDRLVLPPFRTAVRGRDRGRPRGLHGTATRSRSSSRPTTRSTSARTGHTSLAGLQTAVQVHRQPEAGDGRSQVTQLRTHGQ